MRTLKILNTIALATPLFLWTLSFLEARFLDFTFYSIALTGILQLGIAIAFIIIEPKNGYIQLYFIGLIVAVTVVFFF